MGQPHDTCGDAEGPRIVEVRVRATPIIGACAVGSVGDPSVQSGIRTVVRTEVKRVTAPQHRSLGIVFSWTVVGL